MTDRKDTWIALLRLMLVTRELDRVIGAADGHWHPALGEEGVIAGCYHGLRTGDALVAMRDKLNAGRAAGEGYSFTHLLVKLLAQALREHPQMNCALIDGALHLYESVNLGVALALPDGNLVVPVVKDAARKTLQEVARELRQLEARAAAGKLALADVSGGTFTLTNAGMVPGARWTTPIVVIPQCAILGIGAMRRAPVVRNERIEAAWLMPTSLTFDHRAVNGVPASRFV